MTVILLMQEASQFNCSTSNVHGDDAPVIGGYVVADNTNGIGTILGSKTK
jgi:hypothetical protein